MARMDHETFRNVLEREIDDAQTWLTGGIRGEQQRNLQYYMGLPLGNEIDGRSQVVSWDVFETIEAALPNFLEPFFAGDEIGQFIPREPNDMAYTDQATDLVNYIIKEQNQGFLLFQDWFKDALLSKVGIVRAKWTQPDPVREEFKGLTLEQVAMLVNDPAVTILEQAPSEELAPDVAQAAGIMPPITFDITIQRKQRGRVVLHTVQPLSFVINRMAQRTEQIRLIGEFVTYTRSELKEMGFDAVDTVQSYDQAIDLQADAIEDEGFIWRNNGDAGDRSLEEIRLFEGFIRCDYDGDGVAEWRRVLVAGDSELENEEVDDHDYAILTPVKLPHRVIGMAMADPVAEIQKLGTGLTRQYVDSLYLANNPRTYVNMTAGVNLDDVISNRIGGLIRGNGPAGDAVAPIKTALVADESLQGLEMVQAMRERRTGVTRYNQGLDADTLNKTALGITKISNLADKRLGMILRAFAETGVKRLFKIVLRLVTQYQDVPMVVRLRGEFVQFDPRGWSPDMDVSTDVGLGTGDRSETLAALAQYGQFMQIAATAGLVGPEQIYAYGEALAKAAKLKGAAQKFMRDPQQIQQQPGKPAPEMIKAQSDQAVQQSKQQVELAKLQADATEGDKERALQMAMKQAELAEQRWTTLVQLAAGYLMGAERPGQAPVNMVNGTALDQNAQANMATPANVAQVAGVINALAQQLQAGA